MTTTIERVATEYLDALQCPCGNATHLDGFETCTPEGVDCEPDPSWTGTVRCVSCGRLYDTTSFDGSTVAVVRGPAASCRDCKLGAVRTVTGKVKGERDVDPCPAGDDDFHHWTGVLPTSCTNPTHDHDAVTNNEGGDPDTNVCNGCPRTVHYDRTQEWYFHDVDDGANDCFLSGPNEENPCTP